MASKMTSNQALSRLYNIARGTVSTPSDDSLSRLYNVARGMVSPKAAKEMAKGGKAKK